MTGPMGFLKLKHYQADKNGVFTKRDEDLEINGDHIVFQHDIEIPITSAIVGNQQNTLVKFIMLSTGHSVWGAWK